MYMAVGGPQIDGNNRITYLPWPVEIVGLMCCIVPNSHRGEGIHIASLIWLYMSFYMDGVMELRLSYYLVLLWT